MSFSSKVKWAAVAVMYFVLGVLMHLQFSLWLVANRTVHWNGVAFSYSFRDALPALLLIAALLLTGWLVLSAAGQRTRGRVVCVTGYWLLWLVCVAAVDRWLTFSVAEYFHYPQYALLAMLLAKTMDAERSRWPVGSLLALTTLLGAIDELAQYLWITASYSHYFDFNDVLVNSLAAAAGLMLYYGFCNPPADEPQGIPTKTTGWVAIFLGLFIALPACVALAWVLGLLAVTPPGPVPPGGLLETTHGLPTLFLQREPGLYDRWHPGPWQGRHWVLGPWWGIGLAYGVGLAWLPWRLRH